MPESSWLLSACGWMLAPLSNSSVEVLTAKAVVLEAVVFGLLLHSDERAHTDRISSFRAGDTGSCKMSLSKPGSEPLLNDAGLLSSQTCERWGLVPYASICGVLLKWPEWTKVTQRGVKPLLTDCRSLCTTSQWNCFEILPLCDCLDLESNKRYSSSWICEDISEGRQTLLQQAASSRVGPDIKIPEGNAGQRVSPTTLLVGQCYSITADIILCWRQTSGSPVF